MSVLNIFARSKKVASPSHRTYQPFLEHLEDRTVPSVSGSLALLGSEAASFVLPENLELQSRSTLTQHGFSTERYQQTFGTADVYGGQLTLYRNATGTVTTVLGTYYSNLVATNGVGITSVQAQHVVASEVGHGQSQTVELLIDPKTGRYFYQVETRAEANRWFHQVDATHGQVLNQYNAIDTLNVGEGLGVNGDVKDLTGLTNYHGSGPRRNRGYWLESTDGRQRTFDLNNRSSGPSQIFVDANNIWEDPYQGAAVDAQFYANVTEDFYSGVFGRNSYDDNGATMNSVVHVGVNYDNAFWNGSGVYYGDGDGVVTRAYSAGLDVVAHEWTHAVTQYTSNLVYQDESGALNEAFSDIMAAAVEYYVYQSSPNYDPNIVPDTVWLVGEDIDLRDASQELEPGFRNMRTPGEDGWYLGPFPDHYDNRYTGTEDNGGVHVNSSIVNHAFYLLAEGGFNASGGSVEVTGIGFEEARDIFYWAFTTGLSSTATFQDARNATIAVASSLFGSESAQVQATADAWLAVGVAPPAPDTTPPGIPTGLSATSGNQQVNLDWANNPEADLLGYNVYRSTSSGTGYVQINSAPITSSSYTDTGLANGITYYYRVSAVDSSFNESGLSGEIAATPEASIGTIHVGDLDGSVTLKARGRKWEGRVVVTIHNNNDNPVANVTVTAVWSGATSGTVTGVTNADGTVTFSTGNLSSGSSVLFEVTSLSGALPYDALANHDPDGDSDGTSIAINKSAGAGRGFSLRNRDTSTLRTAELGLALDKSVSTFAAPNAISISREQAPTAESAATLEGGTKAIDLLVRSGHISETPSANQGTELTDHLFEWVPPTLLISSPEGW